MAATAQPLATQAALEILRAGGSAVDAAIAANAVLALVEPVSCGPGGDLFAIVWDPKTKKLYGLNGSGRSPKSLTLDEFQKRELKHIPPIGPLPVSVPGCVDAWCELSKRFGKLPLEKVLAPAIRYAREGAPISELIAYYWQRNAALLETYENFKETYMPNGHAPRTGEVFANPRLAATLERIGKGGRAAFYEGEVARTIEAYMKRNGGFLTAEDLAAHHSEWVEPVSTSYRGYDVWELPPNGQGIAALEMLNLLEGFDVRAMGFGTPGYVHAFVEAKKLAFEDRARLYADPAFVKVPVAELISKKYADERRKLIQLNRAA
jgi:gamma-glutamyltranspeptidase/glutathione hydrolase